MKPCQVDFTALVGGALSKRAISVFCTVVALGTTCFSSPVLCAELPFVNWYRYGEEAIKTARRPIRPDTLQARLPKSINRWALIPIHP